MRFYERERKKMVGKKKAKELQPVFFAQCYEGYQVKEGERDDACRTCGKY
jgi:hypothetical protein